VGLVLLVVSLLISCEDQTLSDNVPIEEHILSVTEEIEYTRENLKAYGRSVLALQGEKDFKKKFYALVEESFDGERNVLFKTLLQEEKSPMARRLQTELQKNGNVALRAFDNIEGKNYYPQIFVPFYDELKAAGKLSVKEPVLVFHITDSDGPLYSGYSVDGEGDLKELNFRISEAFARENEVWVVSLNERVNDLGEPHAVYTNQSSSAGRVMSSPSAIVDWMVCRCHHESWAAGASEVNIISVLSEYRFRDHIAQFYGNGPNEGGHIHQFSRSDVRNRRNIDLNFLIVQNWDIQFPTRPYASYVIFEYDSWPTGTRTATWRQGGLEYSWEYRSADRFFYAKTVLKWAFSTHQPNDNFCLEWRARYQL